jgi:tritrans,polycis-undecaprenyl-diphosphate synthase [geranylgeranyl-diphosphate specific]
MEVDGVFFDNIIYRGYERLLTGEIRKHHIPRHIAVIMDGNRRYADRLGIVRNLGHTYGARTTEWFLDWCWELGVKQATIYAFSTENFSRTSDERATIFDLIIRKLDELVHDPRTHERQMRISAIGEVHLLPRDLQDAIRRAEDVTRGYDGMYLNIATAYGGQREILDAVRDMARKVRSGELHADDIDESTISGHLYTNGILIPDVDLIIRTGGDIRTSNFLPWQANGSECAAYFCAPFWPEFRKIDLLRAIRVYQVREHERKRVTTRRIIDMLAACGHAELEDAIGHVRRAICRKDAATTVTRN